MKALPAKLLATWRSWSVRRRLITVGLLALACVGAGIGAYLALKRPGDVLNKDAEFVAEPEPKPRETIKTVNWPVYGYDDQRTRYLPTKEVRPPFGGSIWSFNAGKLLEFSPVVADGALYFLDKDALFYALNAKTGKVQWKNEIGDLAASSPAYAAGTVYAVTLDPGSAVALRARDGKVLWQRDLPGRTETSPLVYGKNVIVGSEDGSVYALDRKTGAIDWQAATAGNVKGGLALDDGILYGANYAGEVFAIKASSGAFVWQSSTSGSSLGRGGPVYSTPAVAFGRVYVGSIDGRVYSFEQSSGEIAWSHSTGDWVYPGPAVADTKRSEPTVYIGSKDQNFYALDAQTGAVRWQKDIGGVILGAASVVGEVAYVAGLGPNIGTYGFDTKTGKQVFEHEFGEYNPVISDGHRLYLTGSSGIRAFEHKPKKQRRQKKQKPVAAANAGDQGGEDQPSAEKQQQRGSGEQDGSKSSTGKQDGGKQNSGPGEPPKPPGDEDGGGSFG